MAMPGRRSRTNAQANITGVGSRGSFPLLVLSLLLFANLNASGGNLTEFALGASIHARATRPQGWYGSFSKCCFRSVDQLILNMESAEVGHVF